MTALSMTIFGPPKRTLRSVGSFLASACDYNIEIQWSLLFPSLPYPTTSVMRPNFRWRNTFAIKRTSRLRHPPFPVSRPSIRSLIRPFTILLVRMHLKKKQKSSKQPQFDISQATVTRLADKFRWISAHTGLAFTQSLCTPSLCVEL